MRTPRQYLTLTEAALNLLKNRPHSEFEIRQKLTSLLYKRRVRRSQSKYTDDYTLDNVKWLDSKVPESIEKKNYAFEIDETIEKLKKEGLVDDQYFTEWYIDQRNTFRPRSNLMLKQELLSKGISNEIISDCLQNNDEETNCRTVAMNKYASSKDIQKVKSYLLRNGYPYFIVNKIISELDSTKDIKY